MGERLGQHEEYPKVIEAPREGDWLVLGLDKKTVTPANLRAAYRKAVLKTHKDAGGSDETFRAMHEAYERIKGELDRRESNKAPEVDIVGKTAELYKEAMERGKRNAEAVPENEPDPDDPDSLIDINIER